MRKVQNNNNFSAEAIYAFLSSNAIWLPIWLILGAVSCAFTQYDFLWDFENYHFYNPWYWFDSKGYDIYAPLATINSFFSPLSDAPLYYLIKWFNNYPTLIYAAQGLWFGGLVFMFHKIALLYYDTKSYRNIILFILTMLIAITGQSTWFQAGSSTNETQIAFFVLWGVYFILKWEKFPELQSAKKYLFAGLILGFVLGVKQTSITYSFAIGITMLLFYKRYTHPVKYIGMFIVGGFIGCMISYGYFLYRNYVDYGNPFMPFLNEFFKSEYFDDINFQDRRHIPVSFWEFLYYPYIWEERAAEIYYSDCRGWVFYTLSLMFAIYAVGYYIIKHHKAPFFDSHLNTFTVIYMLIAYIIWTLFFSILRYLIPLEMFFAIFLVKAMDKFLFRKYKSWLIIFQISLAQILLFEFLSVPTQHSWDRMNYLRKDKFVDMEKINLPPNTLIKLYNMPIAFLVPMIAENNPHFKAVAYVDEVYGMRTDFIERKKFAAIRDKVVSEHKGPVVIIGVGDITAEIMRKNDLIHQDKYQGIEQLDNIDKDRLFAKTGHFRNVYDRYKAGYHRMTVDEDSIKKLASFPDNFKRSYQIDNNELSQMYCRKLYVNINNKPYVICVPEGLKNKILTNNY